MSLLSDELATLSYRSRRIIELRYGLNGNVVQSYDVIAQLFGTTTARIKQAENRALKDLRRFEETRPR